MTFHEPFSLNGRVVLITGGSSGIGAGIVRRTAAAGAIPAVVDLNPPTAVLDSTGEPPFFAVGDVSDPDAIEAAVRAVIKHTGRLDVLVNNVGIYPNYALQDTTADVLDRLYAINLRAHFIFARAFHKHVLERGGGGRIVNISSMEAVKPSVGYGHAAYAAMKAGIIGLTLNLARELAPDGITVNSVLPGVTPTEGVATTTGRTAEQMESVLEDLRTKIPLQRFGTPDDLGNAVTFFASDAASYVTGQSLIVDGGIVLA
jgi:NAD(P)-dependent dehydrogenase (short-subunit alcohol dehydrogenase family)